MDIKDFYPNIHFTKIQRLFSRLGFSDDIAGLLTRLTTYNGCLAQGFSTSSTIANLILAEVSPRIVGLCAQHGITFTFYQDDLTISGGYRIPKLFGVFSKILKQEGFDIHPFSNSKKNKPMPRSKRQEVTGYTVNHKVNVPDEYYRKLRMTIHLCKVKGIEAIAGEIPLEEFRQTIMGKIQYVLEVNPIRGQKLLKEFQSI